MEGRDSSTGPILEEDVTKLGPGDPLPEEETGQGDVSPTGPGAVSYRDDKDHTVQDLASATSRGQNADASAVASLGSSMAKVALVPVAAQAKKTYTQFVKDCFLTMNADGEIVANLFGRLMKATWLDYAARTSKYAKRIGSTPFYSMTGCCETFTSDSLFVEKLSPVKQWIDIVMQMHEKLAGKPGAVTMEDVMTYQVALQGILKGMMEEEGLQALILTSHTPEFRRFIVDLVPLVAKADQRMDAAIAETATEMERRGNTSKAAPAAD